MYGNKIAASWSYQIIETVSVSLHLSLIFFEPSELQNRTTEVTDMQSYTFTLVDGVRSCDYFIFCIRGRNMAGQGNKSCINGSLPYIPPVDKIDYSLSKTKQNFTLTVTVSVRLIMHFLII